MNFLELSAKVTADTSEYDKSLDTAESKGQSFGASMGKVLSTGAKVATTAIAATGTAVIGASAAFLKGAGDVATYGDHIDKASQKMGISAQAYQEWDAILQHSGASIDTMKTSMLKLTKAAEEDSKAFEAVGISQKDLANMNQEEIFAATIKGLQNISDEGQRTVIANKLLGKGAVELGALLNTSAEDTEKMRQKVHELGGVMSDDAVKAAAGYKDSLQDMQTSLNGVKNNMMAEFLPSLSTAMDGLSAIFSGSDVEGGLSKIEEGVSKLAEGLVSKAPQLLDIGGTILNALVTSITANLPVLLDASVPIVMELVQGIIENAPAMITAVISLIGTIGEALGNPENLASIISSAVEVVLTISNAIAENAPVVIPAIVEIIMQMLTALTDESVLMPLLKAGLSVITSVVQGILKAIPVLIKNLPAIITNIVNFLVKSTPLIIKAAVELFIGIVKAIPQIIIELGRQLPTIIKAIVNGLAQGVKQIASVGENLIKGLWNGISNMAKWIKDKIQGFGKGVLNNLKSFFGIHSPSTVFRDEIGKNLALGLGEGFSDEMSSVAREMVSSADGISDEIADAMALDNTGALITNPATRASVAIAGGAGTAKGNSGSSLEFTANINIYASEGQDVRELAKEVSREIQNMITDKEKAYA